MADKPQFDATSAEERANILLVDDQPANLLSLRAILEDLGQNLVEARSGEEALQRLQAGEFAVVLLDVLMPGMDGFEAARRIRDNQRSRHTPIIFLTARDIDRAQLEAGYTLGAVDFLVKPLVPVIVQAKVGSFVELFQEKQQARQEAAQLRLLVEQAKDYAIFLLDPQGYVVSWNPGAEHMKGYRAEEIIGQHFSCFYPQEAIDRGWPTHELQVAQAEGRFEDENWRVRKDGSQFWANVVITALRDEAGNLLGFSKITRDMTERKKAEENARRLVEETTARRVAEENARIIQEQRERLHVTLTSIGDAVISTDAEGRVEFLNPVAEALVGWKTEEAARHALPDVFHIVNENTRQSVENPALRALRDGTIVGLANHTLLISRDGTERPIDDCAAPIRDADGNVLGSVLVFRDITERRRSEQRLRQLADAMPQIVWSGGPDGTIDYLNRRWTEFTGLPQTVGNDAWGPFLHPDEAQQASARWAASLQSGTPFEMEMRLLDRRQQAYRWHLIRTVPIHDEAGRVIRWFGTGTDIHEQKKAEESARYLADASAALAVVVDYESTLQKVANLAVPYFADWSAVDLVSKDGGLRRLAVAHQDAGKIALVQELMREYPPDPQAPVGALAVFRTGKPEIVPEITDELLVRGAKDERHLHLIRSLGLKSYICVPLVVSGQTLGVLTFVTAESGRRYTEVDLVLAMDLANRAAVAIENTHLYQALREADRRKDEFLATLAHELRNPLAPIRNSLQILKMPRVDAAMVERSREMMDRQVQHLVRLVDDLLDVSRVMRGKIELRRERVEFATVIARAVETVQPLMSALSHQLSVRLPPESLPINGDPVRLTQVVGNLLTNAAKYTEPSGCIELTVEREGDMAVLRVRDNGIGIAPDMLPRIFDLFVQADHATTKSQGGLGIGLTLVKNLVELHNGIVEAHSTRLGKGSEFVVRLPILAQELEPGHGLELGPQVDELPPPSGYRLLVVDDNQDAANSLAALLKLQGHDVRVAYSGVAALEIAKTYAPDAVFLDIGMPGMDGYEVARRLRHLPGQKKVALAALTGWGQPQDRRRSQEAGFDRHLVKPVEPKALEKILAELLDAAGK
jgi:PAS domain S-box-containing protein